MMDAPYSIMIAIAVDPSTPSRYPGLISPPRASNNKDWEVVIGTQNSLFPQLTAIPAKAAPPGFRYQAELISEAEEQFLANELANLPLKPFEFHGHFGNRRVVSFGLRYDYGRGAVEPAQEPPAFLSSLRAKVAVFGRVAPEDFRQIGINEYRPGAGIGWHRDKPEFGDVVGVSLCSAVSMRFRKRAGKGWARASHLLERRSVYILTGEVRDVWAHSIVPVTSLRYSVTFRTLAKRSLAAP
jgi:alkylated DNA repair dioxygenase AlkB